MKLKEIRLKNFQGHEDTVLCLDDGINVITGSSSTGKSSIMRSIEWLRTNRPSGDSFVSYWNQDKKGKAVGDTSVSILSTAGEVCRIKNATRNGYDVNGSALDTIGTSVPEQVLTAFPLTDLNIQRQLDPHFMISNSAGEVATYLNNLVKLSSIDTIMSKADAEVRGVNASLKTQMETLETQQAVIDKLGFVSEASTIMTELSAVIDALVKKQEKIGMMLKLVNDAYELQKSIKKSKEIINNATPYVTEIAEIEGTKAKHESTVREIVKLLDSSKEVAKALSYKGLVETCSKLVVSLDKNETTLGEYERKRSSLLLLVSTAKTAMKEITEGKAKVEELSAMLPKTCPMCGGVL